LEARRLYGGQLVSLDDSAAVVLADFKLGFSAADLYQFTRDLKNKYEGANLELHMVGRPILLGWISHYMYEMVVIFALSFVLITLVCFFYFRSLIGVMVPLIKAMLTTVWGFGFIALVGYNVNPLMLLLPFFVFATILSHAVQIMSRFYEEYARLGDFEQALVESLVALLKPSFSAILTDAVGFSVLYLAAIPTLQILAILCTIWLLSITVAVTFSAAAFFVIPMPEKLTMHGRDFLNRITAKISTYENARTVLVCTGVVLVIAFYFSTKVVTGDPTPGTPILWPDAEYNVSSGVINSTFTNLGTDVMQVYVQGPEATMVSPNVYRLTEGLERYLRERIPEFGGVQTLVPIVKKVNAVLNEGDPSYEYVPKSPEAVGMNIYFFRSRGDPNDMDIFADKEWKNGNLTFFLKDHKHATLLKVEEAIREYFSSVGKIEDIKFYYPGGQGGLTLATNEEIEQGHFTTVVIIVATIMLVIYLTYRSIAAAVILMVMLLLADFL
ncbi:MAG: efflux RND transporter permease subunit, partial [Candidatus Binatia bacterium]